MNPTAEKPVIDQGLGGISGSSPPRDWRGRFGVVVCVNGHDRCFYGPSLECPYCEIRSGK